MWAMSDAVNGYVSEFQVYTGKKKDTVERNLGSSVVKTLTQAYYNTYRHLYFHNFFFIQLLLDLLKSGLYGCGTTRTNRKGFPVALKPLAKKGLGERGRSRTYQYGNITATVWQDNKPVPVIASNGDPTIQTEVRKGKDGSRVQVICPCGLIQHLHGGC